MAASEIGQIDEIGRLRAEMALLQAEQARLREARDAQRRCHELVRGLWCDADGLSPANLQSQDSHQHLETSLAGSQFNQQYY